MPGIERFVYKGHVIELRPYEHRYKTVEMVVYRGFSNRQYVRQAYLAEGHALDQAKEFIEEKLKMEKGRLKDQIWRIEEEWYGKQRGTFL